VLRQEDFEFEASQGYIARLCLRKEGKKKGGREGGEMKCLFQFV
jgi:hypothetical protein